MEGHIWILRVGKGAPLMTALPWLLPTRVGRRRKCTLGWLSSSLHANANDAKMLFYISQLQPTTPTMTQRTAMDGTRLREKMAKLCPHREFLYSLRNILLGAA
ncbi:hypothetical protein [Aeromonas rivipollensis]|uniref:hypothetical protein n=1 Tax=Aeromonas rivipollensis TaxID=948519 RepID=UPI0027D95444|nr:hypothetical protein [uncultured Aeromonas sp.]MDU1145506.1 hypothetical protein [Aeromonas hydrophila]